MHRAFVGDSQECGALIIVEITSDRDTSLEVVDERTGSFDAGVAILRVGLGMADFDGDSAERKTFAVCVQPKRHRRARSERRAEKIVR